MRTYLLTVLLICFPFRQLTEETVRTWSSSMEEELVQSIAQNDLSGDVYTDVVSKLRMRGIPADFIYKTFSNSGIRIESEVENRFNHPKEDLPYNQYRDIFITRERISKGVLFLNSHVSLIDTIVDSFGVDPFLLVSIIGIESKYGENSSQFSVFNALHTIIHKIPRKKRWVEKEMVEFLMYCYENIIPPHTIFGSYAGAFGYGQFIPSSFNYFAVDFNRDGVRHPFDWPDVLASVANYFILNRYVKGSNNFSKRSRNWRAIYSYNRSANYVSVVLELRDELKRNYEKD